MSRVEKLYARLDGLEEEFKQRLVAELHRVSAEPSGFFFMNEEYPEYRVLSRYARPEVEVLKSLGTEIVALREKLKEPVEGSLYSRFLEYRKKWSNVEDHHRSTDQNLAKQLLSEIQAGAW
jgi:hypothetical protein